VQTKAYQGHSSANIASREKRKFWIADKVKSSLVVDIISGIGWLLRYDTIQEFNVDWKAECGQLNLAHVTRNKKYTQIYKYTNDEERILIQAQNKWNEQQLTELLDETNATKFTLLYLSLIFAQGGHCLSLETAVGLSCLSIIVSVCPTSNGEQAMARVGRQ